MNVHKATPAGVHILDRAGELHWVYRRVIVQKLEQATTTGGDVQVTTNVTGNRDQLTDALDQIRQIARAEYKSGAYRELS